MIMIEEDQRKKTIDDLLADLEQARQLRDSLDDPDHQKEYEKADKKVTDLNKVTEKLLIQKLKEWRVDAESFLPDLINLGKETQKSVDNVKNSIEVAKNIVEAFSALDKIIQLANSIKF